MSVAEYRQIIQEGINGLPENVLHEIADYVIFLRKKALAPQDFQEEIKNTLLLGGRYELQHSELQHLEEEFINYSKEFPRE